MFKLGIISDEISSDLDRACTLTQELERAIEAGALLSTHLGNGSHAEVRRHPNHIWDQRADDQFWASLIVDGYHLPTSSRS